MLVAVAFCPAPPLLVPEVASGAAPELATVRLAAEAAVAALLDERPDEVVVLGAGPATREHDADASGTFKPYCVDVTVGGAGPATLPLSLSVGAWLLDRAGCVVRRSYVEIDGSATAAEAAALGSSIASRPARTVLLVMGDGSAARTPKAPGALDDRAEPFDDAIAEALAEGDVLALASLDPDAAAALQVAGRAAWQAAAAALGARDVGVIKADLVVYEAPYGVGYFVAAWLLPGSGSR